MQVLPGICTYNMLCLLLLRLSGFSVFVRYVRFVVAVLTSTNRHNANPCRLLRIMDSLRPTMLSLTLKRGCGLGGKACSSSYGVTATYAYDTWFIVVIVVPYGRNSGHRHELQGPL